ncbi:hypothetical protein FQN54_007549 [Arachnomyces sp. PD_36]|nr:hypothetical protein FQN54_007549 [Arachnomyces sp. PD_36]
MAESGSPHGDDESVHESHPMVDLENGGAPEIDSNDANKRHSESDRNFGGTHVPEESDESDNLLLPAEEATRATWPEKRLGWTRHPVIAAIARWARGPNPPRPYKIEPYFSRFQTAPIRLLERRLPRRSSKIWSLLLFLWLWVLIFASTLYKSVGSAEIPGYGSPVRLSCVSRLWESATACGMNGEKCQPFQDSSFAFRCPADCTGTQVLEPYTIGDQEINYQSLVVGGLVDENTTTYRGDSFICAAAIHAGVINDKSGGCGILSRTGEQSNYPDLEDNGISSVGFFSNFPLSFTFDETPAADLDIDSQCRDLRWPLLSISIVFTFIVTIFTTSPVVFFGSIFTGVFFHVALASDPPYASDYSSIVTTALGRFLPAAFVGFVIYRYCVHHTLQGLTAQFEKALLWLGGCWVGALDNYTFDKIPISRLTPHDLQQQPGAIVSLIVLVGVIFAIALGQAWAFRIEGRMPRYLALYGLMGGALLLFAAVPDMNLRIHHYILALLLLPGTALQTRPSLLYQGILVGLFINGIARWGFDSILQTPAELLNGGQLGSSLPQIMPPVIEQSNITFEFPELADDYEGVSVLINDVERFQRYKSDDDDPFTWTRHREGETEYFRFGYVKLDSLGQMWYGDFTKAGTWEEDGSWVHMEPGPSR